MKKILTSLCVVALALVCFLVLPTRAEAATVASGKCGDNLEYFLDEHGVMTIFGEGAMWDFRNDADYFDYHEKPWEDMNAEIRSVVFKSGITYIGANAFYDCENLTQVTFTDTIVSIGCFAFYSCDNLGNFELPSKLESLQQEAFFRTNITKVKIPDSLTVLDFGVFRCCESLTDVYIGGDAGIEFYTYSNAPFDGCTALEEIKVSPDNKYLTAVGGVLFNKEVTILVDYPAGKKDKTYTLPATVDTIWRFSMQWNNYLEAIILPKGLTCIDVWAVDGSENLKDIYYPGTEEEWKAVYVEQDNHYFFRATMHYGIGCAHKYVKGQCKYCIDTPVGVEITTQPKNVAALKDQQVTVKVKATGDGLKYQWYYKNKGSSSYKKISGATKATYSVKMSSKLDGQKLYCKISDQYGNSLKSKIITVTMGKAAKIATQPKSVAVVSGKTAKVTIKATGDGLKYTWYYKNANASKFKKSSVSDATYSVKMSSATKGRQVYCVVKDQYGNSVESKVVTLKQKTVAKITTQPKSVSVANGKTAKVTIKATGDGAKYTWYVQKKGDTKWTKSSVTTNSLSVKMAKSWNGCKVQCVVKDKYGTTVKSDVVTLTMKQTAKITTQPKSVSVANGKTAKVTIKATGDGVKYTWYVLKKGDTKWTKSSVTANTLSVKMAKAWNGCKVQCVVTDKYGTTVKSNVVTLKLK